MINSKEHVPKPGGFDPAVIIEAISLAETLIAAITSWMKILHAQNDLTDAQLADIDARGKAALDKWNKTIHDLKNQT